MKGCLHEGCDRKYYCKGYCSTHYMQFKKYGRTVDIGSSRLLVNRVMAKVAQDPESGCWLWTGTIDGNGYGVVTLAGGKHRRAHRVVYELHRGPIPEGLQLDHLCRVRRCVNPEHLEPVTNRENTIRGVRPEQVREHFASRGRCKNNHVLAGDNVYTNARGHRVCRACKRSAARRGAPESRARGPIREVVSRSPAADRLECGHELRRRAKRPGRRRCPECEQQMTSNP